MMSYQPVLQSLNFKPLPDEKLESFYNKPECQQRNARPTPGKKGPLVGQMAAMPSQQDSIIRVDVWWL